MATACPRRGAGGLADAGPFLTDMGEPELGAALEHRLLIDDGDGDWALGFGAIGNATVAEFQMHIAKNGGDASAEKQYALRQALEGCGLPYRQGGNGARGYAFTHARAWVAAATHAPTDADARVATARVTTILKGVAGYIDVALKGEGFEATLHRYKAYTGWKSVDEASKADAKAQYKVEWRDARADADAQARRAGYHDAREEAENFPGAGELRRRLRNEYRECRLAAEHQVPKE